MVKRSIEPLLWMLFSAGGVAAALMIPVLLFLFGLAIPLGWVNTFTYGGAIVGSGLAGYLLWQFP